MGHDWGAARIWIRGDSAVIPPVPINEALRMGQQSVEQSESGLDSSGDMALALGDPPDSVKSP